MRNLFALALVTLATACAHRVPVAPAYPKPQVDRGTYRYSETAPDQFLVWAQPGQMIKAKEEICTSAYVCTPDPQTVIIYKRVRK